MIEPLKIRGFWKDFDWPLCGAALLLSAISLTEIYSSTMNLGANTYFLKQLAWIGVGGSATRRREDEKAPKYGHASETGARKPVCHFILSGQSDVGRISNTTPPRGWQAILPLWASLGLTGPLWASGAARVCRWSTDFTKVGRPSRPPGRSYSR